MKPQRLLLLATAVYCLASHAFGQNIPLAISYQAVLTDEQGIALSPDQPTNFNLEFRIWDSVQDGNRLWSERQAVSVFQGSFSTLLGTGNPIAEENRPQLDTIFGAADRFLEITILEGETARTFTPRQQMVATPFAFRSKEAEVAATVIDGAVGQTQLASGSVSGAKIVNNAIDSSKIADNAVGASEITTAAVGSDEILDGGVSIDDIAAAVAKRLVPAGSVVAWSGLSETRTIENVELIGVPEGWLLCDGRTLSRRDFPELFQAIGYIYGGTGDNFRVPDYGGQFLRGFGRNGSQDPDKATRSKRPWLASLDLFEGSGQADEFKSHNHGNGGYNRVLRLDPGGLSTDGADRSPHEPDVVTSRTLLAAGGAETRPKNMYVHHIIKAH